MSILPFFALRNHCPRLLHSALERHSWKEIGEGEKTKRRRGMMRSGGGEEEEMDNEEEDEEELAEGELAVGDCSQAITD